MTKQQLLMLNQDTDDLIELPNSIGNVLAYSKKSHLREDENEDSALIMTLHDHLIMAVADGAGGHPAGQKASKKAIESLYGELKKWLRQEQSPTENEMRNTILNAFEKANQELLNEGTGLATTLVVAHIFNNECRSYHTGDSEVLIISGAGNIKYTTPNHSPVGHAVEAGLITQLEGLSHPDRNIVSNFIGRSDLKIEIGPKVPIAPRDTVIVCSDGLTDNFSHLELQEYFKSINTEESCQFLLKELQARMQGHSQAELGKPDDCAFCIFNF